MRASALSPLTSYIAFKRELPRNIHRPHTAAAEEGDRLEIREGGEGMLRRVLVTGQFIQFRRQLAQISCQFFRKHETSTSFFCKRSKART